jgi:hypothetical protein
MRDLRAPSTPVTTRASLRWLRMTLVLGGLSCLLACPPQASYQRPTFLEFTVCEDVDTYTWQVVEPRDAFDATDLRVLVFVELYRDTTGEPTTVEWKWFNPLGAQQWSSTITLAEQYRARACCWVSIVNQVDVWDALKGEWRVEGWIDDQLAADETFTYE